LDQEANTIKNHDKIRVTDERNCYLLVDDEGYGRWVVEGEEDFEGDLTVFSIEELTSEHTNEDGELVVGDSSTFILSHDESMSRVCYCEDMTLGINEDEIVGVAFLRLEFEIGNVEREEKEPEMKEEEVNELMYEVVFEEGPLGLSLQPDDSMGRVLVSKVTSDKEEVVEGDEILKIGQVKVVDWLKGKQEKSPNHTLTTEVCCCF